MNECLSTFLLSFFFSFSFLLFLFPFSTLSLTYPKSIQKEHITITERLKEKEPKKKKNTFVSLLINIMTAKRARSRCCTVSDLESRDWQHANL